MTRGTRFALITFAGLGLAGLAVCAVRPLPAPAPDWTPDYDLTAKPPEVLAPGTVVGTAAPAGWSHLVIKSHPRVRPDQEAVVKKLGRLAANQTITLAAWMVTAFAADVRPDPAGGFRLRAVGLGLGTVVNGKDTVITPATAAQYGVKLDFLTTKQLLTKGYEVQGQARMVIHGPTFGLLDTPVVVHRAGANRTVRYRYALLADRATGKLDVLLWVLDPAAGDPAELVRIAPGTTDTAELVPDPKQFNALGVPNELGFGVEALPPHTAKAAIDPALRPLFKQTKFAPADALALETALRRFLTP